MHIKSRLQACIVHFGISFLIFLVLSGLIVFVWFPGLFLEFGGVQGLKIIAGVDLVLGPVLTLIVFRPAKKTLKFDLSIIAAIQIAALTAGIWIVYNERPAYQVLTHRGVQIVTASDLTKSKTYAEDLKRFDARYPSIVFLNLPKSENDIKSVEIATEMIDQIPLHLRFDLFEEFNDKNRSDYEALLGKFTYDSNRSCYITQVYSDHFSGNACFSPNDGLVSVE